MRRLYKVYAAVVVLVIITLLLVKGPGMTPEIEISFTVSGILYAILVGFFLSGTWSRLVDLRENVIKETSFLETSHRIFSKFKDRKGYERLSGAIKDYVYLYLTLEWVEMDRADKKFREVIDSITGMKARRRACSRT